MDSYITSFRIQSILARHSCEQFFREYLGHQFLVIVGEPHRFADWIGWSDVNRLLEQCFSTSRVEVFKAGVKVDAHAFTSGVGPSATVLPHMLTAILRGGAVLSLSGVDELHHPMGQLAQSLEREFKARVKVTLFVGFGAPTPADPQWDEQQTIILQVVGKTKWAITGPAHGFPPVERNLHTMSLPHNSPQWEGFLQNGDALYIPRGWWYRGAPSGEPEPHLSISFKPCTGLDLLHWLADVLKVDPNVRMDLPRFRTHTDQVEFVRAFRDAVLRALDRPELLQRYWGYTDANAPPRPSFDLPATATQQILPESDSYLELVAPRGLQIRSLLEESAVEVSAAGVTARFHSDAAPMLAYLNDRERTTTHELLGIFSGRFTTQQIEEFLSSLVNLGLLSIRPTLVRLREEPRQHATS